MTRALRSAAPSAPLRFAKAAIAAGACMLLAGCELLAYFDFAPPPTQQSTQVALGPAPLPPPPRPGRASRMQNTATPKPPPLAPMPARPRIAVTSEPVPPAPPAPTVTEPPPPRTAATLQGGGDNVPLRPPPRVDIDPASLVGRSEAQLELALGKALRHERIASGVNWIYDRADCHASFLLLPEVTSGERRVFAYEITPRGNDAPSAAACLGRIAADGQPRRT